MNEYFKIELRKDEFINLDAAIELAHRNGMCIDEYYDPLGRRNKKSWYWCAAVCRELKLRNLILEFKFIKKCPKSQEVEHDPGVIYGPARKEVNDEKPQEK